MSQDVTTAEEFLPYVFVVANADPETVISQRASLVRGVLVQEACDDTVYIYNEEEQTFVIPSTAGAGSWIPFGDATFKGQLSIDFGDATEGVFTLVYKPLTYMGVAS